MPCSMGPDGGGAGAEDDHDQEPELLRPEDDHEPDRNKAGEERHVHDLLAGIGDRPPG